MDALVAMERASAAATVAVEEGAQQQQQQQEQLQQRFYCDYHREAADLGVTAVPEKEGDRKGGGGGGEGSCPTEAEPHAQASSQPAAIGVDAGGEGEKEDQEESGKEGDTPESVAVSPPPDFMDSRCIDGNSSSSSSDNNTHIKRARNEGEGELDEPPFGLSDTKTLRKRLRASSSSDGGDRDHVRDYARDEIKCMLRST